ncbi:MAG TPA: M48 family metallopeptidase [Abditibacteriaceae bacterium]|jgi:predicted Zn-dependent protease
MLRRGHTPHRFRWLSLALCLATTILTVPVQPAHAGLFSVSPEQEKKLGAQAAREIESKARIVRGPVADWVNIVGQRLASVSRSEWKYSFKVIDSPEVNAFALPGGYVYVYTGLRKVAQTDDELAAVLAHEITHAEQHHYAQQYKKASTRGALLTVFSLAAGLPNIANQIVGLIDYSMTQKYSRTHEYESDRMGVERMVRAGFNPQGMVSLLEKMSKEDQGSGTLTGWMRSHPEGRPRVEAVQRTIAEVKTQQAQNNPTVKPKYAPWTSETLQQLAYPTQAAPTATAQNTTP